MNMNNLIQIRKDKLKFDLIQKCAAMYCEKLQPQSNFPFLKQDFVFLFQNKSINELKKYIKTQNALDKITSKKLTK